MSYRYEEQHDAHVEEAWHHVRSVLADAQQALRGGSRYYTSAFEALDRLVGGCNRDMPLGAAIETVHFFRDMLRRDQLAWALEIVRRAATGEEPS